jgi:hypothetical protein
MSQSTKRNCEMLITRKSMVTGKVHTLEIPITEAEAIAYEQGALIQDAFPNLSAAEREFIKTGITAEEWLAVFGESEEKDVGI